jgi:hypothetical protein
VKRRTRLAERGEGGISRTVVFEGLASRVGTVAIDLDNHSLLAPEEVDQVRADAHVHLGAGQPVATAHAQEPCFQLATRVIDPDAIADRQPQVLRLPEG